MEKTTPFNRIQHTMKLLEDATWIKDKGTFVCNVGSYKYTLSRYSGIGLLKVTLGGIDIFESTSAKHALLHQRLQEDHEEKEKKSKAQRQKAYDRFVDNKLRAAEG